MEFKNGYKLLYQKAKEIYASKKNIPTVDDKAVDFGLTEEDIKNLKLIYETKASLVANFTGIPTADDKSFELTANGELVVGPSGDAPVPPVEDKILPFKVGDILNVGDKIRFDTTKEAELLNWLETQVWPGDSYSLIPLLGVYDYEAHEQNALMVWAMRMQIGESEYIYCVQVGDETELNAVYISKDFMSYKAGFLNLDENGDVTLNNDDPSKTGYSSCLPFTVLAGTIVAVDINGIVFGKPAASPTPSSLIPFSIGQAINAGDKIRFDTSLSEEYMNNFLNNLDYDQENNTLCTLLAVDDGEEFLMAYNGEPYGFDSRFLLKNIDDFSPETMYYSTKDITDPQTGITIKKGWQPAILTEIEIPIDIDTKTARTVETIYEGSGWNGKIVGYVKGPDPGPLPPLPETLEKLYSGDKLIDISSIYLDTTKSAYFDELLKNLEYTYDASSNMYTTMLMSASCNAVRNVPVLMGIKDDNTGFYGLLTYNMLGGSSDESLVELYSNKAQAFYIEDSETHEMIKVADFNGGFENMVDGKTDAFRAALQYFSSLEVDTIAGEDLNWNGTIVGKVSVPTPTTEPFYNRQVLEEGDIIHIDTSKTDELLAHLNAIDWEHSDDQFIQAGMYPMLCSLNNDGFIIIAMNWTDMIPGCYSLVCGTMSGDAAIIYNSVSAQGLEAGWHGLDENDNIILNNFYGQPGYIEVGLPVAIDTIYDIETPSWNGGVINFGGHGDPPTPPPAPEMNSFQVGDTLSNGDIIKVDTSKIADLSDYLSNCTYDGSNNYGFLEHSSGNIMSAKNTSPENNDGYYVLLVGYKPIYATYSGGMSNISWEQGWNNVDSEGNFEVNLSNVGVSSVTITGINDENNIGQTWNGIIFGKPVE